jgi:hypothetical protein
VEVWGTSLYPKHVGARDTQHAFFRSAMLTSTRSACDANDAPYWLGELQAGHGYVGMFAASMTADDARHYCPTPGAWCQRAVFLRLAADEQRLRIGGVWHG